MGKSVEIGYNTVLWSALFLILAGLAACNTRTIEYEVLPLHHDLGEFHLRKSVYFDTISQWTHELDCECCHQRKVRLSNREFPLLQEKSWKYTQPDSNMQVTLIQAERAQCDTAFKIDFPEMSAQMKYVNGLYFEYPTWVYRQFEKVDGHDFIVLGWEIKKYRRYDNQNLQRLLAITSIDGRKVTLDFDCRSNDCGNFLRRSFWLLQRMKIKLPEE
ncbi:hypothetical protein [Flavilitoribacter nigricans]|uniref:Uncharacterized protein n=1 Tax=Flavilitoribacter nigricans (strain ATCC 23147 / DSM 23189 / NBRC 102662 / NCIMB 1420 / SS-2) TaxID=1122177 RepID=A0A2D0NAY9_FLAN2|nr:hypothetical protein [Flavilitoribacter nigricans]PHN05647.1 hypothetical protein CRP01_14275 [Flavilitoribacter nigricans DSM 23189 = NBRC 102662]